MSIELGSIPLSDITIFLLCARPRLRLLARPVRRSRTRPRRARSLRGPLTTCLQVCSIAPPWLSWPRPFLLSPSLSAELPAGDYNTVTLSELLSGDDTSQLGYPNPLMLADLLLTTVPPASYPWQSVTLPNLPLAANATSGGDETYTATITANIAGTAQVSVSLPASFAYVPGSSTFNGVATADPTSGSSLTSFFPSPSGRTP